MVPFEIAVIIPNFQRRESLFRACESVVTQSRSPCEVVVVDDGSTRDLSETRAELDEMGISWIQRSSNGGPAAARNDGVAATRSEWIAFLDSDDTWASEKLSKQEEWHRSHSEVRISQVRERWVRNAAPVKKPVAWEPGEGDLFADAVKRCVIGPSCVMMHRSLWEEAGGFDTRFRVCEDYALWLRICQGEWIGKVPGESLVTKEGGRLDQLSQNTPAMDRYRVAALLETLQNQELREQHRTLVEQGILEKCRILAAGARKRKALSRAEAYEEIERTIASARFAEEGEKMIRLAWKEIEGEDGFE